MPNTLQAIEYAQAIRTWCKENLPFDESVVAYDLLILLAIKFAKNERVSVKQIFVLLPHSYTAVRQHYMRLIKDGWIECVGDGEDKRIKYIVPTKKFTDTINQYAKLLLAIPPPFNRKTTDCRVKHDT